MDFAIVLPGSVRKEDVGMDLGLKDKVAIIGGASKGLGRACAQVLSEEGAKVVICSRTASDLEQGGE